MTTVKIILIPLLVGFLVQIFKLILEARHRKLILRDLLRYGGMPSGHVALVTSFCTIIALQEGIFSTFFALAFILGLMRVRDSIGERRILEKQSRIINKLSQKVLAEKEKLPTLQERLSHNIPEMIVGFLVGVGLTWLIDYFWKYFF